MRALAGEESDQIPARLGTSEGRGMRQEQDLPEHPAANTTGVSTEDGIGIAEIPQAAGGKNSYGLAALSLLTGKPFYLCLRIIREYFPEFRAAQTSHLDVKTILAAVPRLGCSATSVSISPPFRKLLPSLAAMLRVIRANKGRAYLIVENELGHYMVLKGWKIYDSYCPGGISAKKYPFRKFRVDCVWLIQNPIKQCWLPFKETRGVLWWGK